MKAAAAAAKDVDSVSSKKFFLFGHIFCPINRSRFARFTGFIKTAQIQSLKKMKDEDK